MINITSRSAIASLVVGAALALPFAAFGQAAAPKGAPTPAPAAAGPVAPPAPPAPSPEARALVKELLDAMNTRDTLTKTFQAISQSLPGQMQQAMARQIELGTNLTPEQKQKVREAMPQPFDTAVREAIGIVTDPKLVDQTIEKMIPIYASHYTVPELKQLTAFYKTPVGVKSLTATPQANGESLQAVSVLFQPKLNALMEKTLKTQVDLVSAKK